MIRFSVIIPLYNKEHYVSKSIESILAQTYPHFEVVVINDGSTDNSLAVAESVKDSRIRIITKENGGVSQARNMGIEKSRYDYICFLDADDTWCPDFLETIKTMIEEYPEAGIFATEYSFIDRHDQIIRRNTQALKKIVYTGNYAKSLIFDEVKQLCTISLCVKREVFAKTDGFRIGVKIGEDADMWLRLSFQTTVVWKNESKAFYYFESENNSGWQGDVYRSYRDIFPYWEWYSLKSFYARIYASRKIWYDITRAYHFREYKDMFYLILKMNWFYSALEYLMLKYARAKRKWRARFS
ncbi:MAG: glycosyltransferase family 2 protein [Fibrobacter sp.]|jgi:glycosyltransferase involved in cell wall biosynthesis|nr:glycosyltransferase family 2 protein [Fibrobacter sp.]